MASPSLFPGVSSDPELALVDMRCMSLEDIENHFVSGADSVMFSKADGAGETELPPRASQPNWSQDHSQGP